MDYQQLLAELEQEQENIARMIVWVKSRLQGDSAPPLTTNSSPIRELPARRSAQGMAPDTFFRMSVPQAIKTYLNIAKRPTSAKEITAALDSGGLTHQAKNLYATVYPTLLRLEEAGEVVRAMKGKWALAEWYPSGRKANTTTDTTNETK